MIVGILLVGVGALGVIIGLMYPIMRLLEEIRDKLDDLK